MTTDGMLYVASEWGARYHALTHNEALGGGAAGPGKSFVLLMDIVPRVVCENERARDPNYIPPGFDRPYPIEQGYSLGRALHLRRTMPMLKDTIDRSRLIFPRIDPGANFNQQTHTWTFTSGYQLQFGHCKDPGDWVQYQSNAYDHIAFDELTQFLRNQYDQIVARNRSSDPVLETMLYTRSMSNPVMDMAGMDGVAIENPHWVRDLFVKRCPEGGTTFVRNITMDDGTKEKWTRIYLHATLKDNPDPKFRRRYELQLQSRPAHIRAALLYGDWFVTANSFYAAVWNANVHTCKPFKIPSEWRVFRSMDWGFRTYGCIHWYALDPDGTLFVIREYTFTAKTPKQVAERIEDIEDDLGIPWRNGKSQITGPADTQLWEQRGDSSPGKAEEFAKAGVPWVPADKSWGVRSRARGAERVYQRLADHDNYTKPPGLVIFVGRAGCPKLLETLPALQTSATNPNEPADGGEDHWHDSLSYGVSFAARGEKGIPKKKIKDEWDEESPKVASRGRFGYGM